MDNQENMMIEQETEVIGQIAENTEHTAEETQQSPSAEKLFTQQDVDRIAGTRAARAETKIRKEYERKYGPLTEVLKAGTGKDTVEDITETFRNYYGAKGVALPQSSGVSEKDLQTLANADAKEIIDGGYEEVVEEMNRLASGGVERMSPRDKIVFQVLAAHRGNTERNRALAQIGVPEAVYSSPEFQSFARKFHEDVPPTEVYKLFEQTAKTSNHEPIGSMKTGSHSPEKTYYSPEDVDRLTPEDYNNPVVMKRVRESMLKW